MAKSTDSSSDSLESENYYSLELGPHGGYYSERGYGSEAGPVLPAVLPSVVPDHVRALLLSDVWDSDAGTLAIQTVLTQLANRETRKNRHARTMANEHVESKIPSLFDTATKKLVTSIGEDAEELQAMEAMEGLPPDLMRRIALKLEKVPYCIYRRAIQLSADDNVWDIDEWVLRNEIWLREMSIPSVVGDTGSSKRLRAKNKMVSQDPPKTEWTRGIARLSVHADVVFAGSTLTDTCRIITRPTSLSGFKVLDGRRPPVVRIQPSVEMFSKTFESMTGGLLKGLNWDHVFVAGGIALGALLCTNDKETTNTPEEWKNSDVDMYIYGLGPVEANKKIEEIFSVFKANLPKRAPVLVVRNSKTITFFSRYPLRRIQVVLKLVDSPKDVLLNFDLDICAVGWDGKDVCMLPRAARAIETGYTVFTMDLINGHYLGDRRATQEQRVFKYADKGYGIRILPSYLQELNVIRDDRRRRQSLGIVIGGDWDLDLDMDKLVENARKWTATAITGIANANFCASVPEISHAWLQEQHQLSEDPQRRSPLSGLSLFMRHVALWEHEVAGTATIHKDSWAAQSYDYLYSRRFGVGYNDSPDYSWDQNFTIKGFIANMNRFNEVESQNYENFLSYKVLNNFLGKGFQPQRIVHAHSVRQVLRPKCDIYLPVWLPKSFIDFANDLVPEAVRDSGMPDYTIKMCMRSPKVDASQMDSEDLELVIWRITDITMWQQLNRTIDEVHEIMWSFHHAYAGLLIVDEEDLLKLLVNQISRRAIRLTAKDEYGEFARWVARLPVRFTNVDNGYYPYLAQGQTEEQ